MKILAVSGSTKKNSTNELILRAIQALCRGKTEVTIYNNIAALPHFNPDLDNENVSEDVINFRKSIEEADGVIFCTPEYVFSLPGSLKNALEWTVSTTVFSAKPVAMIVAAASGEKAYESLQLILETLGAFIDPHSKLLIRGAKGKVNDQGECKDESLRKEIKNLTASFLELISHRSHAF